MSANVLDVLLDALVATQSACTTKMMDEWPKTACGQIQSRHGDGQVETPWPSASRIEIKHPANSLDPGSMRVAANYDVNPARDRIELQSFDVVRDIRCDLPDDFAGIGSSSASRRGPTQIVIEGGTDDVALMSKG